MYYNTISCKFILFWNIRIMCVNHRSNKAWLAKVIMWLTCDLQIFSHDKQQNSGIRSRNNVKHRACKLSCSHFALKRWYFHPQWPNTVVFTFFLPYVSRTSPVTWRLISPAYGHHILGLYVAHKILQYKAQVLVNCNTNWPSSPYCKQRALTVTAFYHYRPTKFVL